MNAINGSKSNWSEEVVIEIAIQWRVDMYVFTLMFWSAKQSKRKCVCVYFNVLECETVQAKLQLSGGVHNVNSL